MKDAKLNNGKTITATDAKQRGIKAAICPGCGEDVRLHIQQKPTGPADHFEHLSRHVKPCDRHYWRG